MSPKLYLTRHGESLYNTKNKLGGDSGLSEKGKNYANKLLEFFKNRNINVYTSKMKRTIETSKHFGVKETNRFEFLNEIDSGIYDGYT